MKFRLLSVLLVLALLLPSFNFAQAQDPIEVPEVDGEHHSEDHEDPAQRPQTRGAKEEQPDDSEGDQLPTSGMMFNFEWSNETLFYGLYERTTSFWDNGGPLKATGTPDDAELAVLQPLVEQGLLSADEAALGARLPVAEDITVESDSGGHTDNQILTALFPSCWRFSRNESWTFRS